MDQIIELECDRGFPHMAVHSEPQPRLLLPADPAMIVHAGCAGIHHGRLIGFTIMRGFKTLTISSEPDRFAAVVVDISTIAFPGDFQH
jgi:hypothetical protein